MVRDARILLLTALPLIVIGSQYDLKMRHSAVSMLNFPEKRQKLRVIRDEVAAALRPGHGRAFEYQHIAIPDRVRQVSHDTIDSVLGVICLVVPTFRFAFLRITIDHGVDLMDSVFVKAKVHAAIEKLNPWIAFRSPDQDDIALLQIVWPDVARVMHVERSTCGLCDPREALHGLNIDDRCVAPVSYERNLLLKAGGALRNVRLVIRAEIAGQIDVAMQKLLPEHKNCCRRR